LASAPVASGRPDWRDGGAYAWLLGASRSAFAWEWLRRSDAYRLGWHTDWASAGLLAPVDPALDARLARPMWSAAHDASVLRCAIGGTGDRFSIDALNGIAFRIGGDEAEHWLISDGLHMLRFDLYGGSLLGIAEPLRWMIDGVARADPALLTLRRLLVVMRTSRFGGSLFAREVRASRWILELRVADALADGFHQREIAAALFGVDPQRWRVEAAPYRLRVQRLVAIARRQLAQAVRLAPCA